MREFGAAMTSETEEPAPASGPMRRRIVVVASLTYSLTNFRLELLKRMVEAGQSSPPTRPAVETR